MAEEPHALLIRDPKPEDEADWRRLWAGYADFYEAMVSEAVTLATWQRLLAPNCGMFGRFAALNGALAGSPSRSCTKGPGR